MLGYCDVFVYSVIEVNYNCDDTETWCLLGYLTSTHTVEQLQK